MRWQSRWLAARCCTERTARAASRARRAGADRHNRHRHQRRHSHCPQWRRSGARRGHDGAVPDHTDLQAQLMAMMTRAKEPRGSPKRFSKTGSCMCRNWRASAHIFISTAKRRPSKGVERLKGAPVMATDLRASVSLVIATLAAKARLWSTASIITDRGFEQRVQAQPLRRGDRAHGADGVRSALRHQSDERRRRDVDGDRARRRVHARPATNWI